MEQSYSARSQAIQPFLAMEVLERALELEANGRSIIHFEIGEPDFPAPSAAVSAVERALAAGETRYTDSRGLRELRELIADDKSRRSGRHIDAGRVIVTSGTSPAMLLVFSLLVEPGDEVIVPSPHYPCYPNFVRFCGGNPVFVDCDASHGFPVPIEKIRAAITPRTRAIVIASPANPTGAVQSSEVMRDLAALGLPLVSDEIYHGILYDDVEATSALAYGGHCYVLDGFSKRYAMTGFRLGYLIAPSEAVRALQVLQQNFFISASEFVQRAGIGALRGGHETVSAMSAAYDRRRRRLVGGLRKLGFEIPVMPKGAFYVLAGIRAFAADSREFASKLLEETGVATTPGVDFGRAGEGCLRFCYAVADDAIEEGLCRLAKALSRL